MKLKLRGAEDNEEKHLRTMGAANIPLPALAIKPPEQPDLLQKYGQIQQIQGRALQNQATQRDLQDQEIFRQSYIASNGNMNAAIQDGLKRGMSVNSALKYKADDLEQRQKLASLSKDEQDTLKSQMTQVGQAAQGILALPPEQRPAAIQQALRELVKDPQQQQQLAQSVPQDPARQEQWLRIHAAGAMGVSDQLARIQSSKQEAREEQLFPSQLSKAQSDATTAQVQAQNAPQTAAQDLKLKKAQTYEAQARAGEATAATQKAKLETQFLQSGPEALQTVPPNLRHSAAEAANKAGQAFSGAQQTADNMAEFMREARSGNKSAVKIVPLEGALDIVTAQGVHRINRTEVDQYGGAGSLFDRIAGKLGGAVSGKDIPDDVLDDMEQVQNTIAKNARAKYEHDLDVVNHTYNATFKPVDFGQSSAGDFFSRFGGKARK